MFSQACVILSVHRGGGGFPACITGHMNKGGLHPVCIGGGGSASGILQDMVNKQA